MKKKLILFCTIAATLMGYSCSSDDNSTKDEEASIVGEWQIQKIDFSYIEEDVEDEMAKRIYKNDFCVSEYVTGYEFLEDGSFIFVITDNKFGTNEREDLWTWEKNGSQLNLTQLNPSFPPYDFGLETDNLKIEKKNGKWTMTFEATWWLGSTSTFTLVKTNTIDTDVKPQLSENGAYREPCGLLDR